MANLKVTIDVESIAAQFKETTSELENSLMKGIATLAQATKHQVEDWANNGIGTLERLKSSRSKFLKSLQYEEVAPGVHVISVGEEGLFIEEGIPPGTDMKPKLLKGRKSMVVPFEHSKKPQDHTAQSSMIRGKLLNALKKEGLTIAGKEYHNEDPRTPKLSEVGPNGRLKPIHTFNFKSPTFGKGNTPVLHGVNIYQTQNSDNSIQRSIFTFRTVSNGPKSAGKFIHPGTPPRNYLDKAEAWFEQEWNNTVLPNILAKYNGK
jgi:hypothetical protein